MRDSRAQEEAKQKAPRPSVSSSARLSFFFFSFPLLVSFSPTAGVESGSTISVFYDPLIAKVIAQGATRAEALQRMRRALQTTVVLGDLVTNQRFLLDALAHPAFARADEASSAAAAGVAAGAATAGAGGGARGGYDTRFIEAHLPAARRLVLSKLSERDARYVGSKEGGMDGWIDGWASQRGGKGLRAGRKWAGHTRHPNGFANYLRMHMHAHAHCGGAQGCCDGGALVRLGAPARAAQHAPTHPSRYATRRCGPLRCVSAPCNPRTRGARVARDEFCSSFFPYSILASYLVAFLPVLTLFCM